MLTFHACALAQNQLAGLAIVKTYFAVAASRKRHFVDSLQSTVFMHSRERTFCVWWLQVNVAHYGKFQTSKRRS